MWCCYGDSPIVGVLAMRVPKHISLLFVDPAYHRRGIARSLMDEMTRTLLLEGQDHITVNSSKYATGMYGRLGFEAVNGEQVLNGIRFTAVRRKLVTQ